MQKQQNEVFCVWLDSQKVDSVVFVAATSL